MTFCTTELWKTIVKQLDFPNCVARLSSESIKNFTIPSKIGFQDN